MSAFIALCWFVTFVCIMLLIRAVQERVTALETTVRELTEVIRKEQSARLRAYVHNATQRDPK